LGDTLGPQAPEPRKSRPFDKEADLETAITEIQRDLFGSSRVYLEVKKLIGQQGKTQNIPDGYLLDFSSPKKPVLARTALNLRPIQ
jgi:hypothetical protein